MLPPTRFPSGLELLRGPKGNSLLPLPGNDDVGSLGIDESASAFQFHASSFRGKILHRSDDLRESPR